MFSEQGLISAALFWTGLVYRCNSERLDIISCDGFDLDRYNSVLLQLWNNFMETGLIVHIDSTGAADILFNNGRTWLHLHIHWHSNVTASTLPTTTTSYQCVVLCRCRHFSGCQCYPRCGSDFPHVNKTTPQKWGVILPAESPAWVCWSNMSHLWSIGSAGRIPGYALWRHTIVVGIYAVLSETEEWGHKVIP